MEKTITIRYTEHDKKSINCDVDASSPFSFEEMIYGLSNVIHLFCQNTGVHPIQVSTHLQNFIVEGSFRTPEVENQSTEETENKTEEKED